MEKRMYIVYKDYTVYSWAVCIMSTFQVIFEQNPQRLQASQTWAVNQVLSLAGWSVFQRAGMQAGKWRYDIITCDDVW